MVLRREDAAEPRWIDEVRRADWIYFSGGRPQHAIDVLADSPFWRAVLQRHRAGAVLAGASAGAMMLGEKTFAPDDFDDAGIPHAVSVRVGLGLLRGHFVIPHFDLLSSFPPARVNDWVARWPAGLRCLALDEDTALVEGPRGWAVHGKGRAVTMRSFAEREVHTAGATLDGIPVSV
jgi:cyanophycinase